MLIDATDLAINFSAQDYTDVATDNTVYVDQSTTDPNYAIFLFKARNTVPAPVTISWNGKSSIAPSSFTVTLEVYNVDITTWELLQTNSTAGVDEEFNLGGIVDSGFADYYDIDNYISCRVYQPTV